MAAADRFRDWRTRCSTSLLAVGHSEGRGTLIVTVAKLLQNVLGFMLSIIVLHRFGMAGMGTLTIASVGVVIQATMLTFGMPYVLAKSKLPSGQRNAVALGAVFAGLLLAVPLSALLAAACGHGQEEAMAIMLLAVGGSYFAHASIADAVLVLESRTARVILAPVGSLCGMLAGAAFAGTLAEFAGALAIGRLAGIAALFARLDYRWCGLAEFSGHLRQGVRFLVPDTLGLMAEQMVVIILAPFTTRSEMGQFGLCRQFLTVAETPMWSRLVVWYPRLCANPALASTLWQQMARRGMVTAAVLMVVAPVVALTVYRSPEVASLAPLFLCCIPFRYVSGTIEIALRARDALPSVNRLVVLKCALVLLVPVGLYAGRVWGIGAAVVLQTALVALAARRELRHGSAGLLATQRGVA